MNTSYANNNTVRILRKIPYFTHILTLRERNFLTVYPMQILSSTLLLYHQMEQIMFNPCANPTTHRGCGTKQHTTLTCGTQPWLVAHNPDTCHNPNLWTWKVKMMRLWMLCIGIDGINTFKSTDNSLYVHMSTHFSTIFKVLSIKINPFQAYPLFPPHEKSAYSPEVSHARIWVEFDCFLRGVIVKNVQKLMKPGNFCMGIRSLHARTLWAIVGCSTVHVTPLNCHLCSGFALWECSLSEKWCIVMCFYAFLGASWGSTQLSTLHQSTPFVLLISICIPLDITCTLDPSRTFRLVLLRKSFF